MLSLGADVAFGRNARIECFAAEGDLPGRPKLIIGSGSTFGDGVHIVAEDLGTSRVRMGDRVGLQIQSEAVHLFDADGIGHHPPEADGR